MKHFSSLLLFFVLLSKVGLAQYEGQSGIQLFYQRDRGFDFRSGSAEFDVQSAHLNGGGFGFDYGITDWFALWSQVAFYSGVRQGGISMNLINEIQGMKLTSPGKGPFRVYAKGESDSHVTSSSSPGSGPSIMVRPSTMAVGYKSR